MRPMPRSSAIRLPNPRRTPTLSVVEAGRLAGYSRDGAYRAVKDGAFPSIQSGRKIRIPTARFLREVLGIDPERTEAPV